MKTIMILATALCLSIPSMGCSSLMGDKEVHYSTSNGEYTDTSNHGLFNSHHEITLDTKTQERQCIRDEAQQLGTTGARHDCMMNGMGFAGGYGNGYMPIGMTGPVPLNSPYATYGAQVAGPSLETGMTPIAMTQPSPQTSGPTTATNGAPDNALLEALAKSRDEDHQRLLKLEQERAAATKQ